jgi:methylase of polypeptide subunit release factors
MTAKPIALGTSEQFARVRSFLRDAGFNPTSVCRTFNVREISDLADVDHAAIDLAGIPGSLALCIKIFLFEALVPDSEIGQVIDPPTLEAFLALGLLRRDDFRPGAYYAPVLLYPLADLLIASDRFTSPDGSTFAPPADLVFPAFHTSTALFLRLIAKSPAADALDLGTGSGIAAFLLSESVARVVASDVTRRATHFTNFNRLLNQRDNVEVVRGDLYNPVDGHTFDRIAVHCPYVPAVRKRLIFADGGITGEALIRRAVEGLPRYLRPGGTFYAICTGLDTRDGPFEDRVRSWLGPGENEFEVIVAAARLRSLDQLIAYLTERQSVRLSEAAQLRETLERSGMLTLVWGALVVHRRLASGGTPRTQRVKLAVNDGREEYDPRQLEWSAQQISPEQLARIW